LSLIIDIFAIDTPLMPFIILQISAAFRLLCHYFDIITLLPLLTPPPPLPITPFHYRRSPDTPLIDTPLLTFSYYY
jgi:hypothetical protein